MYTCILYIYTCKLYCWTCISYIYIWSIHYMTIYAHHRPAAFFGFGFSSFQTFACGEVTPPLALRVHVFGAPAPLASWQVRLIPTRISGTVRTSTHIIAHHQASSSYSIIHRQTTSHALQWSDGLPTRGPSFHLYWAELYKSREWDLGIRVQNVAK